MFQKMLALRFALNTTRKLTTTVPKQAGSTYLRVSMSQTAADAYNGHPDIRIMFRILATVMFCNGLTWWHSAGDARFFFGNDQVKNGWLKYMTEKQWCQESGRGLKTFGDGGTKFWFGKKGHQAMPDWVNMAFLGFHEPWKRDVYTLICDIETYKPKGCPRHPLPLGGCGHPTNKDSPLTKLLKWEGYDTMWCENVDKH